MKTKPKLIAQALFLAALTAFAGNAPGQEKPASPADQPAPKTEAAKHEYVKMTVSGAVKGDIILELNAEKAPISTENFLKYVDKEFYNGTIFHRVISNFMIQGGGFTSNMQQKSTEAPIKNEWKNGLKNTRGTISMARTPVADSATSQFFINVVDNTMLDAPRDGAAYAVFGKVVAGMNVVDQIKDVPVANKGGHQNVPVDAVVIEKVTRLSEEEAKNAMKGEKGEEKPQSPNAPNEPKPSGPKSQN